MADEPISGLTETTSVTGNEFIPIVQSGVTKKIKQINLVPNQASFSGTILFDSDITLSSGYIYLEKNTNSGSRSLTIPSATGNTGKFIFVAKQYNNGYNIVCSGGGISSTLTRSNDSVLYICDGSSWQPHLNISNELLLAISGKEPTITAGTTSQYWRGDKTWQTFPTISTPSLDEVTDVGNTTTNDITVGSATLSNTTVSTLPFIDTAKKIISATGALLGTWFQTLTADTNPVDADTIIVNDSTASFEAKKTTLLQLWTNYLLGKVQALGYLSGSGLTTNTIPRANAGALQDSYITEITTNAGGSVGATRPYPLVATDPSGTGSFSGYLKWVDNGSSVARLFIYKPYTNGQGAGWYQILDTQNPSFPALATSSPAFGMGLSTMTNSTSTAPTNIYTGEIRNLKVGSQLYGLGVFQNGAGFHYLKPFGGNHWEFTVAVNSYMRDWDWEVIGATANSGKGGGSNTLSNLSKIGNSTVKFRAMANANSPYYYIEGVFKVNSSGAITSLVITQPSSNTTAFNVSITDTRIQFTGNAFSLAYVICEKIAGQYYGALYTTPYENERYSADATVKYWVGDLALGSATINARSQLHLQSTSKGFLPNVLTTAQRDAVSWVAGDAGMIIYNSTTNKHQGWNGTTWNDMY